MRTSRLLILLALAGCSSTDSTPVPAAPEPAGWIYFSPVDGVPGPPARIDVRTGEIRQVHFPPPYDTTRNLYMTPGWVSPINGDIAGIGFVGGVFPETFVYHSGDQFIEVFRDADHGSFTVSLDVQHAWSPDGAKIVFTRYQTSGCCDVLVVLHPATGETDTLISDAALVPTQFFWFGSDTVVFLDKSTWRFKSITLGSLSWADWGVVAPFGPLPPVASADREWIAHWEDFDSTAATESPAQAWRMELLNRRTGIDTIMVSDLGTGGTIPLAATIDPDSRYLAFCTSITTISAYSLASKRIVKEISVPNCFDLKWSWGPEGRAADMAE